MPVDMEAMEALITTLNSTNKSIFIMDQIYINAMLTMYLNEYNRKNIRNTTFLLTPFNEETNFTDSEGMFTANQYYEKIGNLSLYNFAGTDAIYLDLTLLREASYHILCQIIMRVVDKQKVSTSMCQIVVRTQLDLGKDEQEFFANMGVRIFGEIFTYLLVEDKGIGLNMAFNALTGKTKLIDGHNLSSLRQSEMPFAQAIALPSEAEKEKEKEKERIKKLKEKVQGDIDELRKEISQEEIIIAQLDNAIQASLNNGLNPRKHQQEAEEHVIARSLLIKKLNGLLGEINQTEFTDTFKRKEIDKTSREATLKAQKDEMEKLERAKREAAEKEFKAIEDKLKKEREAEEKKEESVLVDKLKKEFITRIDNIIKQIREGMVEIKASSLKGFEKEIVNKLYAVTNVTPENFIKYKYEEENDPDAGTFKINKTALKSTDITPLFIDKFLTDLISFLDDLDGIFDATDLRRFMFFNMNDIYNEAIRHKEYFNRKTSEYGNRVKSTGETTYQQRKKEEDDKIKNKQQEEQKEQHVKQATEEFLHELRSKLLNKLESFQITKGQVGANNAILVKAKLITFLSNEDIYSKSCSVSVDVGDEEIDKGNITRYKKIEIKVATIRDRAFNYKNTFKVIVDVINDMIGVLQTKPANFYALLEELNKEVKRAEINLPSIIERIKTEGHGVNIAKIHGGATKQDTNFLDEIHEFVYIKKINKFNKSTYIISI